MLSFHIEYWFLVFGVWQQLFFILLTDSTSLSLSCILQFCFKFNLEGTHKTLDKDLVVGLVDITLKERIAGDRLTNFKEFLNTTKDVSYDRITLDQWISFLDFSIDCPDLSVYDEDSSAWPVLIDDYVDFSNGMKM